MLHCTFLMAGQGSALLPPRPVITGNNSSTLQDEATESRLEADCRKIKCLFHSSSAQDLRCFEMEKEKHDETSPRGVIEACIKDLKSESGSPEATNTGSQMQLAKQRPSFWQRLFKLWKGNSLRRLPSFPPLGRRKTRSVRENKDTDLCPQKSSWRNFTLSDLQNATNNFSEENLIGKGGYAEVYKGSLPDGQLVAVKQLSKGTPEEQVKGFLSEIGIIAHLDHPNTAKMIGYGVEGGTFLVLQLSSLGSLASLLHGPRDQLHWCARYKIVLGVADGLLYLHENCQRRVIHRDIKADNILLTEDFEPQICDFGLAKWLPKQWTHHNVSKFEGTFGYFAPEYFMHGIVDEKTDVFSFGVLLLELITGCRALDDAGKSLVLWAKPLLDKTEVKELADPCLHDNYNSEEINRVILTASLCVEQNPVLRPRMSQVVGLLRGQANYPDCPREHQKRYLQRTYSEELLHVEEYNSTKYLSDLNQLKQIALES